MKGILRTIPKKKLAVIQKELTNTEVLVNVRNAIAPHARTDTDGFTYVSQRALERITQRVVDFECFCCQKQGAEAKHCQLRRDIESTYMFDYTCPSKKECPFAGMMFEEPTMKTKIYKPGNLNPLARKMLKDQRVSVVVENFLGVDWHQKTASTRRN